MYIAQMEHFIDCVKKNISSTSGFGEGKSGLRMALNIKKSVSTNQFIKR